jgi:hypothetical protein
MGIGVNAQYDFTQDFENDTTGFYQFGGGVLILLNFVVVQHQALLLILVQ